MGNFQQKRHFLWGFFAVLTFLLLFTGGHPYGADGIQIFLMTDGLWQRGIPDIPQEFATGGGTVGVDGQYYSPFTLGQPILLLPWYAAGRLLESFVPAAYTRSMVCSTFNAFVTAGIITAVAASASLLGFAPLPCWVIAWILGLTTIVLPYSRYDYTEPLFTLALFTSFVILQKGGTHMSRPGYLGAGGAVALSILVRPVGLIVGLPVVGYFLWKLRKQSPVVMEHGKPTGKHYDNPSPVTALISFFLPILIASLFTLAYNYGRFGGLFDSGYATLPDGSPRGFTNPPWWGLLVLLMSPGKSFFLLNPVMILVAWDARRAWKRFPAEALTGGGIFLMLLGLYSTWCRPEGGYTWGPRFLLTALPFLVLLLLPRLEAILKWKVRGPLKKLHNLLVPLLIACLMGFFLQFLGIGVNYAEVIDRNPNHYYSAATGQYRFNFFPFFDHLAMIIQRSFPLSQISAQGPLDNVVHNRNAFYISVFEWNDSLDFLWLHLWKDRMPGWLVFGVPLLLFLGCVLSFYFQLKALKLLRPPDRKRLRRSGEISKGR